MKEINCFVLIGDDLELLKCSLSHKDIAEKRAELEQQSSPGGLLQIQKLKTKSGKASLA